MIYFAPLFVAAAVQATTCALSVHAVSPQGVVKKSPLLSQKHIASIQTQNDPKTGETLWLVRLDEAGAKINSKYSKSHLGQKLAIYCGSSEVQRVTIVASSSNEFVFTAPASKP